MASNVDLYIGRQSDANARGTYLISGGQASDVLSDLLIDRVQASSYMLDEEYYVYSGGSDIAVGPNISNGIVYLDATGLVITDDASSIPDYAIFLATFDSDGSRITRFSPLFGSEELDISELIEDTTCFVFPGTSIISVSTDPGGLDVSWAGDLEVTLANSNAGAATKNIVEAANAVIDNGEIVYVSVNRAVDSQVITPNIIDLASADLSQNDVILFYNLNGVIYAPRIPGFQPADDGYIYNPANINGATYITYDNATSEMSAVTVQQAIDELDTRIEELPIFFAEEEVQPTATNTPGNTTFIPANIGQVEIFVNGIRMINGATRDFTVDVSGVVTWNDVNAGFDLETTDKVFYKYVKQA